MSRLSALQGRRAHAATHEYASGHAPEVRGKGEQEAEDALVGVMAS